VLFLRHDKKFKGTVTEMRGGYSPPLISIELLYSNSPLLKKRDK